MNPNPNYLPPRLAARFLRWYCRSELLDEVAGDLYELFQRRVEVKGLRRAQLLYWFNVLMFLHPDYIRKRNQQYFRNSIAMFKQNLLLTIRSFQRYRSTFLINLLGLSTGLACAILIFLWVSDELSVDKFHINNDRLYQLLEENQNTEGRWIGPFTAGLLAETLKEEFPEIDYSVPARLVPEGNTLSLGDKSLKAEALFAGPDFFQAFSFGLTSGDPSQVLTDKKNIVISEALAKSLFTNPAQAVGKTVAYNQNQEFQVAGVFEDTPANSSLQFDFVLPFAVYQEMNANTLDWNFNTTQAFVVLREDASLAAFNQKISGFLQTRREESNTILWVRPFSDAYLYGNYEEGELSGGRIAYVRLFSIIAVFILIIACINFTNLTTARATRRLKEIGIKKAIGVRRSSLVFQYLGESVLVAIISLLVAVLLVGLFLPQFNSITGKELSMMVEIPMMLTLLGITIGTGLVAGAYPAIYLSGFSPLKILKGGGSLGKFSMPLSDLLARKGLVVFQFVVSVILIVAVLVVYQQIAYVQNKNLGYTKENVLYFDLEGKAAENLETFLNEIEQLPYVDNASSIGQTIVGSGLNTFGIDQWEGKPEGVEFPPFEMRPVALGMIELLNIRMLEGRTFSPDYGSEEDKIIFNQAAIAIMGLDDPLGQKVFIRGTALEIIGVTEDFHFASLHEEINPLFFVLRPTWTHKVMVKVKAGQEQSAIDELTKFYQAYNPGFPFDFRFLDEEYQAMYVAEQRVSTLSAYFAGIAILISCLGLFGLSAFTAERRLKEISIRKIMGASSAGIVALLSTEFTHLVLISVGIAVPISFLMARNWLDNFAYSIELKWWYFALAAAVTFIIAWLSVGLQTIKAALINPVESLKNE